MSTENTTLTVVAMPAGVGSARDAVERIPATDHSNLNYIERTPITDAEVMRARLAADASRVIDFKNRINRVEDSMVEAGCDARELGLSFQAYYLPPKKESAEVWFNKHYAKHLRIDFKMFKWLIEASKKMPQAPKVIADVMPVQDLMLFAADKIDKPLRTEAQLSHAQTPYNFFFNTLRGLKADASKQLKEAAKWDPEMFPSVRTEIEGAVKFLSEAMTELSKAEMEARRRATSVL